MIIIENLKISTIEIKIDRYKNNVAESFLFTLQKLFSGFWYIVKVYDVLVLLTLQGNY